MKIPNIFLQLLLKVLAEIPTPGMLLFPLGSISSTHTYGLEAS
jgi:hypothetical protein